MNAQEPTGQAGGGWLSKFQAGWSRLVEPVPAIQGDENRRRARLLSSLLLAFIAIGLLAVTGRIFVDPNFKDTTFIVPAAALVVFVGAYALSNTRLYTWGAAVTVATVYLAVFAAVLLDPRPVAIGITLNFLATAVLLGSLLLSLRDTLILTAACLGGALALPFLLEGIDFSAVAMPLSFVTITSLLILVAAAVRRQDLVQLEERSRELAESEEGFRGLFESTFGGMAIHEGGRLVDANTGFAEMFGYGIDEMMGMGLTELMAEEYKDQVGRNLRMELPFEAQGRRSDGGEFPVEMVARAQTRHGRTVQVIAARDITERKQAEEALAEQARWLEHYATELERSNEELEQFAYMASHDLQEPLRMVTSYLGLIERRYKGRLDSDADDFIAFAVDGATRMHELIRGLLEYSRVGTLGEPFGPTDSQLILDAVLDNLQVAIGESEATVTHDALPTIVADPTQLVQLIQNLISNAIKFRTDRAPVIHVGAERQAQEWVFTVRDNGIGIAPEYLDRVFLVFQRLHPPDEYPGTGIGLAVCRRIVERHGGRMWLESEEGVGSTFYFSIPVGG
jgi:PAS domain S-box-containing protein